MSIPSEDFRQAFSECTNGCRRVCACGRTFFDDGNVYDWEPGELEELEENQRKDPDKYRSLPYGIGCYRVAGSAVVWDCDCKFSEQAVRIENLILNEAPAIAQYLNERAKKLRQTADRTTVTEAQR